MKDHRFHPESLMMSYGYKPEWSEGAIKCPIFQTSTFVFSKAEEGKAFFEVAYGLRDKGEKEKTGLIYSRINNPDLEILENRLSLWDKAEEAAVFESGMSAITTVFLEFLKPGDLLVFSSPVYGGTDHFIRHFLNGLDVMAIEFTPKEDKEAILQRIESSGRQHRLKLVYVETPANPTNTLIDLTMCREIANAYQTSENPEVIVAVDNTYMGPLWQHPLDHGADLSIYSATKYIGGHSDVIAGAICGSSALIKRLKVLRTFLGNMCGPWTGWLLLRSLETLVVRMERQALNAQRIAAFLQAHPKVEKVYYPGLLSDKDGAQYEIYKRQCLSPGAMISFDIKGGEAEAFAFLNQLRLVKMAVSLGSTESLAEHPASMTHAGVDPVHRLQMGISDQMVRLSVGVENSDDLIWDLAQALE